MDKNIKIQFFRRCKSIFTCLLLSVVGSNYNFNICDDNHFTLMDLLKFSKVMYKIVYFDIYDFKLLQHVTTKCYLLFNTSVIIYNVGRRYLHRFGKYYILRL